MVSIRSRLEAIDTNLDGLQDAIRAVERARQHNSSTETRTSNVASFTHIDANELKTRRAFVSKSRSRLKRVRAGLIKIENRPHNSTHPLDENAHRLAASQQESTFAPSSSTMSHQVTMDSFRDTQDDHLVELENVLGRIGETSHKMASELDDHVELLDDLHDQVDHSEDAMNMVRDKIGRVMQTDNNCHITTIMVLTGVVLFLVFLIIYG